MLFKIFLTLAIIVLASAAGYFSVHGLATLYAGQFLSVCIMGAGLEYGKLMAVSYLHRHWKDTKFLLKTYLIAAVLTLMAITSMGIFGFLTAAHQQSLAGVEIIDAKKEALQFKAKGLEAETQQLRDRITILNEVRKQQEQRVIESGNYKTPREQAYAAIESSNKEIKEIQSKIEEKNILITELQTEEFELKIEETKSSDIGTLKFVAQLFNTNINELIKWFTIAIVFAFDPLAVALVLALNNIVGKNKSLNIQSKNTDNKTDSLLSNLPVFKKILTSNKIKYQDK